mgnify:CR=1 FL=1
MSTAAIFPTDLEAFAIEAAKCFELLAFENLLRASRHGERLSFIRGKVSLEDYPVCFAISIEVMVHRLNDKFIAGGILDHGGAGNPVGAVVADSDFDLGHWASLPD